MIEPEIIYTVLSISPYNHNLQKYQIFVFYKHLIEDFCERPNCHYQNYTKKKWKAIAIPQRYTLRSTKKFQQKMIRIQVQLKTSLP